jgi:RNA polymerase sigma factor (sigma-70 family)
MLSDKKNEEFTKSYNNYFPLIYSITFGKVNDADMTEDICQEVFIRLYNKFDEVLDHRKWLYGTVRLVMLEHVRKDKDHFDIDEIFDDKNFAYVNGFRDTRIIIQEAIDDTENFNCEEDKILFHLIAVNNFSYKKAGEQIGMSERQSRYKYNLTVDRLEKYFRKKGFNSIEDLL